MYQFVRRKLTNDTLCQSGRNFDDKDRPRKDALLSAMGLNGTFAGGGIVNPRPVMIPPGSIILRCYGATGGRIGSGKNTPRELHALVENSGRSGAAFDSGRKDSKGYLHAGNDVLEEWDHSMWYGLY